MPYPYVQFGDAACSASPATIPMPAAKLPMDARLFRRIRRQTSIGNPHVAPRSPIRHRNHPCGTAVAHVTQRLLCDADHLARSARTAVAAQKKGEPKGPPILGAQSQPAEITRRPRTGTAWSSRPARRPAGRHQDPAWSNPRGCRPRPPRHQPGGSQRR